MWNYCFISLSVNAKPAGNCKIDVNLVANEAAGRAPPKAAARDCKHLRVASLVKHDVVYAASQVALEEEQFMQCRLVRWRQQHKADCRSFRGKGA